MNLFLSRLFLNSRSRQVASELMHSYEMHRTLMHAFPELPDGEQAKAREKFGVLFRVEEDVRRGRVAVLVQSLVEPDWTFLDGLDGYLNLDRGNPSCECKDITPACWKLVQGQILSFRLRANPTKRIGTKDDEMKGKRVELYREDEQIAWLMRKGTPGGFELLANRVEDANGEICLIPRVNVQSEGKRKGNKKGNGEGHTMTHFAVLFDGFLRVTDADAFRATLARGIGSGKAFGFGLLSVAPVGATVREHAP